MKVVLAALNAKYVHSNLAVYNLVEYAKKQWKGQGPEFVIEEYTINHNLDQILQSLYQEKAAVVAFSCYIWNIYEILTIAKELHKVSPDTKIWLGGPEVSYHSEELLEKNAFVHGIMKGEGEATFYELTRYFMGQGSLEHTLGIIYRNQQDEICDNGYRPLLSMDEIPFIYSDMSKFEHKILYYESSRGCPFSCSYCLSSIDKSVRFRSLDLVQKELDYFLEQKVSQVKFIDRTFNCKREHSLAIWRYLSEHDNGVTNFHFEVSADLIGEEELEVFRSMRPGLIQLEIGLQSTNPETIKEIRRVMDVGKLKQNMLTIRSYGNIHQHLDLIAGLPYEDYQTFQKSFNDAYVMKPNQLQLGFLKVLKGSYMGEKVETYELKYQDVQPYEVLSTKWITYDEILALKNVEEMVEVYYNSDQFEHVLAYVVPHFVTPFEFYEALGHYYDAHQFLGIGLKRETRYRVLLAFCKTWADKVHFDLEIVESLLTIDYYLRENAKSRPAWRTAAPIDKNVYQGFFKNAGTEEYHFDDEGYDSKVAARIMHVEPVCRKAVLFLKDIFINDYEMVLACATAGEAFCLFDYAQRNPLSKDAGVILLSHL